MKKIILFVIIATILIVGFFQFDTLKQQITQLANISAQQDFAVGDCVNDAKEVTKTSCESSEAIYIITSITDPSGATCSDEDNGVITQKRSGSIAFYCVKAIETISN